MCGIAGILDERGEGGWLDREAMLLALRHRGPDQQGGAEPSPGVWLGATRLAICDLSDAGSQPMATFGGDLTVVHNGEIYNAPSLRGELERQGHRFRSRCDTEVLLHGYREWGDKVVERLEGMFAFALWDRPRRRLMLARDPLGIKPLWLARSSGRLVFASEVRALAAAGAVPWSIAPSAVVSFLATGSVAEPGGILRGVEALAPGQALLREGGAERSWRHFVLPSESPQDGRDEGKCTEDEAASAASSLRARLETSMARCFQSDVPVALLLSGGIDSSALAVLARGAAGRSHAAQATGGIEHVRTFHVRVGESAARRAAALAERLGLRHQEVRADANPDVMAAALAAQDQPSVDGANTFLIARAIREAGYKVAITGLGADELFLGYALHRAYVRARALQQSVLRPVLRADSWRRLSRRTARALSSSAEGGLWRLEKLAEVSAARGAVCIYQSLRSLFPVASRERLLGGEGTPASAKTATVVPNLDGASAAGEVSRLDLTNYLVNTLLRDADAMSMANSVELRVPMLDRELVAEVLSLSAPLKLRAGRKKPLLVDAVPELARDLEAAPKEGFELPLERWLSGPLRNEVRDSLLSIDAARRLGLDPVSVERTWRRFENQPDRASAHRAWALHALVRWADSHDATS